MSAFLLSGPYGKGHGNQNQAYKQPFGLVTALDHQIRYDDGYYHRCTTAYCGDGYTYATGGLREQNHAGHENESQYDYGHQPTGIEGVDNNLTVK